MPILRYINTWEQNHMRDQYNTHIGLTQFSFSPAVFTTVLSHTCTHRRWGNQRNRWSCCQQHLLLLHSSQSSPDPSCFFPLFFFVSSSLFSLLCFLLYSPLDSLSNFLLTSPNHLPQQSYFFTAAASLTSTRGYKTLTKSHEVNHIICWKKRLEKKAVFLLQLLLLFLAITFMFSYNTFGLPRSKLCTALH